MIAAAPPRILLIGYGNPGRLDDGLGAGLASKLEKIALPNVTVDIDYQLSVEHAELIARHDVVIFADAAVAGPEPFGWSRLAPTDDVSFSSHSVSPAAVLGLAHRLFDARTRGYVLGIRGYLFNNFEEALSAGAQENLIAAVAFVEQMIRDNALDETADRMASAEASPDAG
jgi:hydrogenase maturation protease